MGSRLQYTLHCVQECPVNHGRHSLEGALAKSMQRGRQLLTLMVERIEDVYAEEKMEKGRMQTSCFQLSERLKSGEGNRPAVMLRERTKAMDTSYRT